MSCTKRRQTDLLRFGKKRETLNPWSGHGGEAGSICFWNFNSMLVLGSICFAEFPRAKFRLHSTPHSPSSDKTLQTSPPPHVCLCVVTMRKKESTHSVQFYMQIIFFCSICLMSGDQMKSDDIFSRKTSLKKTSASNFVATRWLFSSHLTQVQSLLPCLVRPHVRH